MFVNTLGGLQFALLQVEAPSLHLGLVRQGGEPVVETANDRNVPGGGGRRLLSMFVILTNVLLILTFLSMKSLN